jgi:5-hydroxyisourate hydrolase-like protein (transthyretin family)
MSMNMWGIKRGFAMVLALGLLVGMQGCGGGGDKAGTCILCDSSTSTTASTSGVLTLTASSTTVSSASPAQITAVLKDAKGSPVAGQVVTFKVVRSLATTGVSTALTNANGEASTTVAPASSTSKGADEVTASVSYAGKVLEKTVGFQFNATDITLAFGALPGGFTLSAYGQTSLVLNATGASVGSPVSVTLSSACVALGKGTISPSTATLTSGSLTVQYQDNGCGALRASDIIQASVPASTSTATVTVPLTTPGVSSLGFVSASPEQIYLKGSGLGESSLVTFVVRDSAGNPLQNQDVSLSLLTGAGGVTMEGQAVGAAAVSRTSDAQGRVSVRINSGTVPTPVRVQASLPVVIGGVSTTVSTVSSNLSVAVGLPSQLNFSLSQRTLNIEGFNIDCTTNTYNIIAADRSGNPVPAGTTINFRAEGGQVVATAQTQLLDGIARASVNFVSAQPKPADGRVTITAYALGEESFEDLNGNNIYDPLEPFQDLGNIFFDRRFNGVYEASEDEFLSLGINSSSNCAVPANSRLALGVDIPSRPGTCDGSWSGAGTVYVRRATETVLSTSAARPLWASTGGSSGNRGLDVSCQTIALQPGSDPAVTQNYVRVAGQTWFTGSRASDFITLIVADANGTRLNPMAAGTTVAASTTTTGLTVTLDGGTPVPSTLQASLASLSFNFSSGTTSGLITVRFTSPSGVTSAVGISVVNGDRPSICDPP